MTHRSIFAAATVLLLASAAPALAQQAVPAPADNNQIADEFDKDTVTVGVGAAYLPDYDGSNDYRVVPAPVVIGSVKGFNFSVIGNRASLDLARNQPGQRWDIQFGPIGVVNFDRQSPKNIDDLRVRALGKIDTAIELGGYIGLGKTGVITSPYDKLSVSISMRHDVNNVHKSSILQPSINYLTPLSRKAAVALFGTAQYVESGYGATYFSITPAQSLASGLPTYSTGKGWKNYSVGGLATYSLTGDLLHGFKLVAGGTYSRMLGSFADAPIVRIAGSRNQWVGAAGVAYTF
ncbi:MipA/OmpV family protein [Sphingomonas echinoides]|uniref:MipA/OmpV family protein n=1 Tax=Sphingomonas echinoides TaxID=59803 RepID=UPI0024138D8E|nr:MipA/OmpV family protein [Sphingomonas echinoides]